MFLSFQHSNLAKGCVRHDDDYLKTPVNFAKKFPPKFYEKIQTRGNQTLKRLIFVELKKGGAVQRHS